MELLFSAATFLPQVPWTIATVAPKSKAARAVMSTLLFPVLSAGIHFYVDFIGFQSPDAVEQLAKFGGVFDIGGATEGVPLAAFTDMLANPNFVTEEWAHVLAWDLFVGRWIWMDALARDVPLLRPSLLLTNFTGPPGLLLYLTVCLLSGKGLPGNDGNGNSGSSSTATVLLPTIEVPARADDLADMLFGGKGVPSASAIAAASSEEVVWDDMGLADGPVVGRAAVYDYLSEKFESMGAAGGSLVVERMADGETSTGFTWHLAKEGVTGRGLRGTTFMQTDDDGKIVYVREGNEPLYKPGAATAELLKAVASSSDSGADDASGSIGAEKRSLTRRTPEGASDLVRYLWTEVQGSDAKVVDESITFFAPNIRYEDFNYKEPFLGAKAVEEFLREFDIPGLTFVIQRVSDGSSSACFTWEVDLGVGSETSRVQGLSFYELDSDGRIAYVRDIPAPAIKPAPLASLLGMVGALDPALKVMEVAPVEESTTIATTAAPVEVEDTTTVQ